MDLWHGALTDFVRAAGSGSIAGDMTRQFVTVHRTVPGASELASWDNSLGALADALADVARRDVGVLLRGTPRSVPTPRSTGATAAEPPVTAIGVAAEYHLPLSGMRVDVLLCGTARERRLRTTVAVELKQWSHVELPADDEENVLVAGAERPHPARQALDYAEWLAAYHSAFTSGAVHAAATAYCHNLGPAGRNALHDERFRGLLTRSAVFTQGEARALASWVEERVGAGGGLEVLDLVISGRFAPSPTVLGRLEEVVRTQTEWHVLGEQRVAHQAILADVRRARAGRGKRAVLVRGAPGTGKTVIAVQLLADAARLGWRAVHSTGGKAFTTTLRSKFPGADKLFVWNWDIRKSGPEGLDLVLVDEAHRLRKTSDNFRTPKLRRTDKAQIDEIFDASRVAVFFLDENQFVRPDEIGTSELVRSAAAARRIPLREYDLAAQFRCGGCREYVTWVDGLLGFGAQSPPAWQDQYRFRLVRSPEELAGLADSATRRGERARMVAGFCWRWSEPCEDGSLVADVTIGSWARPWNRKRLQKKHYTPRNDPYTLWAETAEGLGQIGCIYSAQGFEFESVGVIWGPDLVWRTDRWVARPEASWDRPVKSAAPEQMLRLVRNAYRVLLTRGTRETNLLVVDEETHAHVAACLGAPRDGGESALGK